MAQFLRRDVNWLAVDSDTVRYYGDAVAAMQAKPASDPTSWSYQAAIHGTAAANPPVLADECRHGSWWFLSWHRMYLYYFERIVRAQVVALGGPADWALPFWDYDRVGTRALPEAFRSPTRSDGSANPLYVANRGPGINSGGQLDPLATTATHALSRTQYTGTAEFGGGSSTSTGTFLGLYGRVETTPHNAVHGQIGGLMGNPLTAAQDPIFWLHHCNVDRLWWVWQQTYANPVDTAWLNTQFSFFDETATQVTLTGADVENIDKQLDYDYARRFLFPNLKLRKELIIRPPWPIWLKEIPTVPIPPREEPRPPFPPGPGPEMIGATEEPIRLIGVDERIRVPVDARARDAALGDTGTPRRIILDIQDIDADVQPGTVYGVYVNAPEDATPEELRDYHVENIALFGIERQRSHGRDEHGHGAFRIAVDITDLVAHLTAQDRWSDEGLDVTFRPLTVELPADSDEADAARAAVRHEDNPIRIGRVSVHVE